MASKVSSARIRAGAHVGLQAAVLSALACLVACHPLPDNADAGAAQVGPEFASGPPLLWPTQRLCVPGVLISNQALGDNMVLSVLQPTRTGGPQVVEVSERTPQLSYTQVWRLINADPSTGACWLDNPRPPFNRLSVSLDARGNLPDEENASGVALQWLVQRVGRVDVEGEFDDVPFELVPVSSTDLALEPSPDPPHALRLSPRETTAEIPSSKLWKFTPLELCAP